MMRVAAVIPFRGNTEILRWTLEGFALQQLPEGVELEVRVGGDGCEVPADIVPARSAKDVKFTAMNLPRCGTAEAKNLLLKEADAQAVIFFNSDTRPAAECVAGHVRRLVQLPEGSFVLGDSPYERSASACVFERMLSETPMIFFYSLMKPGQYYDYRHAWTLNLSCRMADFRKSGGFSRQLPFPCYEDVLLGWRMMGSQACLYYEKDAVVLHRHPMEPAGYFNREEMLGLAAPILHQIEPELFQSLFGTRDIQKLAEEYRRWVEMDQAMHRWIYQRLMEWADLPENVLGTGEARQRTLNTLYQMHIPLKRLAFRLGFLKGMQSKKKEDRVVTGLWKGYVEG